MFLVTFIPSSLSIDKYFETDSNFGYLYPKSIRQLDKTHWSPLYIIHYAAKFLADKPGARILDIGSGVGKFCLAGAHFKPEAFFYGVEQRASLIAHAEIARKILGSKNVIFQHSNFTQLDFENYDHFYFYNSFYENLSGTDKIDEDLDYSPSLFSYYNRFLLKKLESKCAGTRLVTFQSFGSEVPANFQLVNQKIDGLLKFWIKT
ncbi:MAG: methyltransferase domain-containing protein [Bacteroidetes bacterium]|nr:methyltransferase domain-containing protein [Bacteroidota bacterium]